MVYTINEKFIIIKFIRTIFETVFICNFFYVVINAEDTIKDLSGIMMSSLFCYYIELLCNVGMIYNYLKEFGKRFNTVEEVIYFKLTHVIYLIKYASYFCLSFLNIIFSFFVINGEMLKDTKLVSTKILLFFIVVPSGIKVLFLFILLLILSQCYVMSMREKIKYEKYFKIKNLDEEKTCSICLESNNVGWTEVKCKHLFHFECLKIWIEKSKTCPICREEIFIN